MYDRAHSPFYMLIPKRVVAEISKTWPTENSELLSHMFEDVISKNRDRGYALESWQLSRVFGVSSGTAQINETIIAVFVKS